MQVILRIHSWFNILKSINAKGARIEGGSWGWLGCGGVVEENGDNCT